MVVVGPISHRGAAMLHRAVAPIVVFFAIMVGGIWATLSQVVWSSESESTIQGGHFNVSHTAHPHHWMVVYDEYVSGVNIYSWLCLGSAVVDEASTAGRPHLWRVWLAGFHVFRAGTHVAGQ